MAAGVLLASAAACGTTGNQHVNFTSQFATSETPVALPPSTPAAADLPYPHHWDIDSRAPNGSTWSGTVEVGKVYVGSAITNGLPAEDQDICDDGDPASDALIPLRITTTATTSGFPTTGSTAVQVVNRALAPLTDELTVDPLAAGEHIYWASPADGQCEALDSYEGTDGVPIIQAGVSGASTGQTASNTGFLVLTGYASPNYPDGDPNFLANVWLKVPQIPFSDSQGEVTGAGGAHLYQSASEVADIYGGWFFPVSPHAQPDCARVAVEIRHCHG